MQACDDWTLFSDVWFLLQTPGGVFGARSRSPGVGAELTSELSHDQADAPCTGWSEHNTEEEVGSCGLSLQTV